MHIENCHIHHLKTKNIIVDGQIQPLMTCSQFFQQQLCDQQKIGVRLDENSILYFLKWNQYLVEQLQGMTKIVETEGLCVLFEFQKLTDKSENQVGDNFMKFQNQGKQIWIQIVKKYVNLLNGNINFVLQQKQKQDLKNPLFLKDLFSIMTKRAQLIIQPVLSEFIQRTKNQLLFERIIQWKRQVMQCIQLTRQNILKDCAENCLIYYLPEKCNYKSDIKKMSKSLSIGRLQTQHSFSTDFSTGQQQYAFEQDQAQNAYLTQSVKLSKNSAVSSNSKASSTQVQINQNDLRMQNKFLREILNERDSQIEELNILLMNQQNKLIQFQKQNFQLIQMCEILQKMQLQTQNRRIPQIQFQLQQIQIGFDKLSEENNEHIEYIEYISKLENSLQKLQEENKKLNQYAQSKYYINPVYQKQNISQKLLQEVVQLEAINMQKSDDISIMINCIQKTSQFIKQNSLPLKNHQEQINILKPQQNQRNLHNKISSQSHYKYWENLILPQLKKLQTVRIKSL